MAQTFEREVIERALRNLPPSNQSTPKFGTWAWRAQSIQGFTHTENISPPEPPEPPEPPPVPLYTVPPVPIPVDLPPDPGTVYMPPFLYGSGASDPGVNNIWVWKFNTQPSIFGPERTVNPYSPVNLQTKGAWFNYPDNYNDNIADGYWSSRSFEIVTNFDNNWYVIQYNSARTFQLTGFNAQSINWVTRTSHELQVLGGEYNVPALPLYLSAYNPIFVYCAHSIPYTITFYPDNGLVFDQLGLSYNPTLTCFREANYDFIIKLPKGKTLALRTDLNDTNSPVVGTYNNNTLTGVNSGTIMFTPATNTPNVLFYLCVQEPSLSGTIIIKDQ